TRKTPFGHVVEPQADARQIVALVACGRVELTGDKAGRSCVAQVRSLDDRAGEIGAGECCAGRARLVWKRKEGVRQVSAGQVGVGQIRGVEVGTVQVSAGKVGAGEHRGGESGGREVLLAEVRSGEINVFEEDPSQVAADITGRRVELGRREAERGAEV